MNISFNQLTITVNEEEAYTLYATIKHGIVDRIKDHWKNHPDAFITEEICRLNMLYTLAKFTGHNYADDKAELQNLLLKLSTK